MDRTYGPQLNLSDRAREVADSLIAHAQEDRSGLLEWKPCDVFVFETLASVLTYMEILAFGVTHAPTAESQEIQEKMLARFTSLSVELLHQVGFTKESRDIARDALVQGLHREDIWISLANDIGRKLKKRGWRHANNPA